jgi:RNA polymerase-binding transcription factor DksA
MAKVKSKKPAKKLVKAVKKATTPKKKVAANKVIAKKMTSKKTTPKKVVAKKAVAKKIVAKKVIAKNAVAKKIIAKKAVAKKIIAKKAVAKKVVARKTVAKPAEKKVIIQKPVAKKVKLYKKNSKTRYTSKELIHFKKVLVDEKERIIRSAKANMMTLVDSESGDYVGDDSSYASHMAEQGSDEMEREKNYMFVQRDEKYLGYIEEALTRIDQGTYGLCIDCMDEPKNLCPTCPLIPGERLEIVPITQHCIECKNIRG